MAIAPPLRPGRSRRWSRCSSMRSPRGSGAAAGIGQPGRRRGCALRVDARVDAGVSRRSAFCLAGGLEAADAAARGSSTTSTIGVVADHAGRDRAGRAAAAGRPRHLGRAPAGGAALPAAVVGARARWSSRRQATWSRCSSRWRPSRCRRSPWSALRRADRRGAEAALKFFIASVVATAFTLLGISLVYGATGSVAGRSGRGVCRDGGGDRPPVIGVGMVLTVVGLAFKVAAVPFQVWVPDTYVGAPIPVAAYLSVVSKAAGLAGLTIVLVRFFGRRTSTPGRRSSPSSAALTMTVGNLGGAAAAACRAAAGLVVGRAGRLPARAARRRRHARRRRPRCSGLRR